MSGTKRFTNLKRLARNIRDTLGTEDAKFPAAKKQQEIRYIIMLLPRIFSTGIMI